MTWLKYLYVLKQFTDSLYHLSGLLARETEKVAKEIWAPSGLTPSQGPTQKAWDLVPVLESCQRNFADHCEQLPGTEETALLAAAMCKAADKLTAREGRA